MVLDVSTDAESDQHANGRNLMVQRKVRLKIVAVVVVLIQRILKDSYASGSSAIMTAASPTKSPLLTLTLATTPSRGARRIC